MRYNNKFTLVELLVVLGIIAILTLTFYNMGISPYYYYKETQTGLCYRASYIDEQEILVPCDAIEGKVELEYR